MRATPRFESLAAGLYQREDLHVHFNPTPHAPPPSIDLDGPWRAACARWPALFNGPQVRLRSFQSSPGRLCIECELTDYRSFLGTNLRSGDLKGVEPARDFANPIGVSGGIVTRDGEVILIVRSENLSDYPGFPDTVGGGIHVDETESDAPAAIHPFDAMGREVEEELGLKADEFSVRHCLGLYRNRETFKPELVFDVRTTLEAGRITSRCSEIQSIRRVRFTREGLEHLMNESTPALTPSCEAWAWAALEYLLNGQAHSPAPAK